MYRKTLACAPFETRDAAKQAIRNYCGWHIAPKVTETITVDILTPTTYFFVPTRMLESVIKIEMRNQTGTYDEIDMNTVVWNENGLVELTQAIPAGTAVIRATITHGYNVEEIPDVLALRETLAKRSQTSRAGIASQAVNGASVSYATAGGAPLGISLLNIEKQALQSYKIDKRKIIVGGENV